MKNVSPVIYKKINNQANNSYNLCYNTNVTIANFIGSIMYYINISFGLFDIKRL